MPSLNYHSRVTAAYQSTLDALERAGVSATVDDTGGSCKQISIGTPAFHIALVAAGNLTDARDEDDLWEVGAYVDAEQVAYLSTIHYDAPEFDNDLAETVAGLILVAQRVGEHIDAGKVVEQRCDHCGMAYDDGSVGAECSRLEADLMDIHDVLVDAGLPGAINAESIRERIEKMTAKRRTDGNAS